MPPTAVREDGYSCTKVVLSTTLVLTYGTAVRKSKCVTTYECWLGCCWGSSEQCGGSHVGETGVKPTCSQSDRVTHFCDQDRTVRSDTDRTVTVGARRVGAPPPAVGWPLASRVCPRGRTFSTGRGGRGGSAGTGRAGPQERAAREAHHTDHSVHAACVSHRLSVSSA